MFLIASGAYHISLDGFANKGDGESYLRYARAILGDPSTLNEYDRRVFPGYPTLIAFGHLLGLSLPLAALATDWLCAGIAAAFAALLFGDRRVGWAMLFLVPHYLCNSTLAMSEAPLLAFTVAGAYFALRGNPVAGGLLLGAAGLIRPMACFAAAGAIAGVVHQRQLRRAVIVALTTAAAFALGVAALQHFSGDALRGIRIYRNTPGAYGGQIFELPFHALATIPFREHVAPAYVAYIYAHVAIVLAAIGLLIRRCLRSSPNPLDVAALVWLAGNTAFELCVGHRWGFQHFPRFAIPAQPALFWALCPLLPKAKWPWWTAAAGVGVLAVVSVCLTP